MATPAERSASVGRLTISPEVHAEFLRRHVEHYAPNGSSTPAPVAATPEVGDLITEFIDTIKNDEEMYSLFNRSLRQVSKEEKERDLEHFHRVLTSSMSSPPGIYVTKDKDGKEKGEPITFPIYLVLDLLSNTSAAYDLLRKKAFNVAMKKLLDGWGDYLKDENSGSNSTLDTSESGWLGKSGLEQLQRGLRGQSFEQTFGVKPEEALAKYKSWDAFFTREFKDIKTARPIKVPEHYTPIYSACDSFSFRVAHNVKLDDTFWLKGQNYSLYDMFGGDTKESLSAWAPKFVGGSVFQGVLVSADYHRWHSPIKGTVLATTVLPGTYYATLPDEGGSYAEMLRGHGAMSRSLSWLSIAATRGVVIMEPQDESSPIAFIAIIAIGMMEVSTIDITVSKDGTEGKPKHVDVGDQLGMFHFGGSSFATVVKPKDGYEVIFNNIENKDVKMDDHIWVNEIIGRVVPQKKKDAVDG
ncbi:Phosphatidylserine decarboxylase domain containing protein [Tylopilus felleus]